MIRLIRKPPTSKTPTERLKISLLGQHSLDDKGSMELQIIAYLQSVGFTHAGPIDFYVPLIDRHFHPLTHFPDGTLIADHIITITEPYSCAADEYDRRYALPPPEPR